MEFDYKAIIIGVSFRNLEVPPSGQHFFVDIVFIDKSNEILHPLLYQFNNEAIRSKEDLEQFRRNHYFSLNNNAFAMIGEVLEINKRKKLIQLKNNNTVAYKHLITATGLSQTIGSIHDEELSAGFYTLAEALRINKNTQKFCNNKDVKHAQLGKSITQALISKKSIENLTIQNLTKTLANGSTSKSLDMTLAGTHHRLYEVQL